MDLKYRIINTTVKPIERDARGNDIRKLIDKVGHPVKFKDKDKEIVLHQGQMRLISELNSGILALQRGRYIKAEKIEDMSDALKDHVFNAEQVETKDETLEKIKAVEMGLDDYKQDSGKEYDGAINPDGDPNFLVKAKRNKKNATATNSVPKDGESA